MTEPRALALWNKLNKNAVGRLAFSAGVWAKAPYFATVVPVVRSAEPGRVVMSAPKWPGVHNHIGTFHAIAACNLAEAAMGVLMEVTVPPTHQWIPKGMSVEYLRKAPSGLTATAQIEVPDFAAIVEGLDVVVPVSLTDKDGNEVVRADITTWVRARS
ncbi:hotdog fold domain-containing protein [Lolliginicoccus suaedae]|uniref:hotdog fold domain-containing protein n=1 Tax=Lolliginicoccus suaedae TaxID=2605429 RepID=UPI0011EF6D3D|nr:hotdog fold domain-containing protein [Lolliginicoccus suaedae]